MGCCLSTSGSTALQKSVHFCSEYEEKAYKDLMSYILSREHPNQKNKARQRRLNRETAASFDDSLAKLRDLLRMGADIDDPDEEMMEIELKKLRHLMAHDLHVHDLLQAYLEATPIGRSQAAVLNKYKHLTRMHTLSTRTY